MKDQNSNSPARRAAAYWFLDGLPELVAGAGLLALGAGMIWFGQLHPEAWPMRIGALMFGLLALLVVFAFHWSITGFLKSRITYPRTGYVRPPADLAQVTAREPVISLGLGPAQRSPDQNVTDFRSTTIGAVICGQMLAGIIARSIGLPIALSVVAVLLYILNRHSERPYHWASLVPLPLAGLAAMYLQLDPNENSWAALLIGGVWLAMQGAWRLFGYVRRYPKHEAEGMLRP